MIIQIGNINSSITGSVSYQESLYFELLKMTQMKMISVSGKRNKFSRIFEIISTIVKYRTKIQIAIIHSFSTNAFYITLIAALICRFFNIKYLVIVHGGDYPNRIIKTPRFVRMIFKYSAANISPSKFLQFEFGKHGYDFEFIPNAVDLNLFKFTERVEFKPNLLWVRAFDKIYNPTMAVLVVLKIKNEYPNVKLWMVGNNRDESYFETKKLIKDFDLVGNIELTGVLTHAKWAELSKKADIFINTTNIDNMPVSVLQAMSLGLPVFSTDVGGIKWLIDDNVTGIKCKVDDADEMATKILYYLRNQKKLVEISKNALDIPLAYQWENVLPLWKILLSKFSVMKS
jgi:glycosyltransferase involved in cell wall biosynthesis